MPKYQRGYRKFNRNKVYDRPRDRRMYGKFECPECESHWESGHTYLKAGTTEPYTQKCKECMIDVTPYDTEPIVCQKCQKKPCICENRAPESGDPHRHDLCERCLAGQTCGQRY